MWYCIWTRFMILYFLSQIFPFCKYNSRCRLIPAFFVCLGIFRPWAFCSGCCRRLLLATPPWSSARQLLLRALHEEIDWRTWWLLITVCLNSSLTRAWLSTRTPSLCVVGERHRCWPGSDWAGDDRTDGDTGPEIIVPQLSYQSHTHLYPPSPRTSDTFTSTPTWKENI